MTKSGGEIAQGKAKDAGGLTPAKDDNAALRDCYSRTFAGNSDDCYRTVKTGRDNMNILVLNGSPQPNGQMKSRSWRPSVMPPISIHSGSGIGK